MDTDKAGQGDGGFPGTWFVEGRFAEVRTRSGEGLAASYLRLLATASTVVSSRFPGRRIRGRIRVSDLSSGDGFCSSSVTEDGEVAWWCELPLRWLSQEPEVQKRALSRLLSNPVSSGCRQENQKEPGERTGSNAQRPIVQFLSCTSLFEPRERRFVSVPPAAFFMAPALQRNGFRLAVDTLVLEPFAEPGRCPAQVEQVNRERLDRILEGRPYCIAVTAMDFYLEELRCLLREIRKGDQGVLIAVGGPLVTLYPEKAPVYLPQGNVFISGEADVAFSDVLSCLGGLRAGDSLCERELSLLKGQKGLFLRFGDTVYASALDQRNRVDSLDALFPEAVDLGFIAKEHVERGLYLHTTRGCPFACSFCAKVHGSHVRALGSDTILRILSAYRQRIDEIRETKGLSEEERSKALNVTFSDDDFLLARSRAKDLFRRISEHPFQLKALPAGIPSFLSEGTSERSRFDPSLFEAIKAAKTQILSFEIGTDEFTEQELARLAKGHPRGYTLGDIEEVLSGLEALEITNRHFAILSNPATRWSDLFEKLATLEEWSWSYPHFYPDPNPFVLAPAGTPLFSELAGQGRADALARKVFTVPDFPEFTHWVFNMAPPGDRLFSTDSLSTMDFFNRLCDLLKSRFRFSIVDDAYLHFVDVCSRVDPSDGEVEERTRILDQMKRVVRSRGERVLTQLRDPSLLTGTGSERRWRLNLWAHMLSGLFLLRDTLPKILSDPPLEERGRELQEQLGDLFLRIENCLEPEGPLTEVYRGQLAEALAFGKAQPGMYKAGTSPFDRMAVGRTFIKTIEARLHALDSAEQAEEWRALCAHGRDIIRLDVTADRQNATFVEDPEKLRRFFELMGAGEAEEVFADREVRFIRAETVLRRSIRDDFLGMSETRVYLYDRLASLPLDLWQAVQQEFEVSPVFDKDGFITLLLSKFLVACEVPHNRAMHATSLFDGLDDLLRDMIPRSLADFSTWFLR